MATLKDLAQAAGVSARTVSVALNGDPKAGRISAKRVAQIRQLAKEFNYRPNVAARSVRNGKFNTMAMLVGSVNPRHLPAEMLLGAEEQLAKEGYRLLFSGIADDIFSKDFQGPSLLDACSSDGFMVHYTHDIPDKMRDVIRHHHLPCIWLNVRFPTCCAYCDDERGAVDATRRLLNLGHRKIVYASFEKHGHYSETDRKNGYLRAMKEGGFAPEIAEFPAPVDRTGKTPDIRHRHAENVLDTHPEATAFLCYEASTAGPLLTAAKARGLKIPRDLSLITFSRLTRNDTGQSIDTALVPMELIGNTGARMLLQMAESPDTALPSQAIPPIWVPGTTCAPPHLPA